MGAAIARAIADDERFSFVAGVDLDDTSVSETPTYKSLRAVREPADVVIDFSSPAAIETLVADAASRAIPLVVATTGLSQSQLETIDSASQHIAVLQAANMSLGINLLRSLVRRASSVLGNQFDIEIIEKHHKMKKDAPSGTALALADDAAAGDRDRFVYGRHGTNALRNTGEIGIHAVRGGTIVGEHDVVFAGPDEVITLRHTAYSRSLFASGALAAAAFLVGRPAGRYTMDDVLAAI